MSLELVVLNGLKVEVDYSVGVDYEDVAQPLYIESFRFVALSGRRLDREPGFLKARLNKQPQELARLEEACLNHYRACN